ncbi:MAG: hypothetical protein KGZ43_02415 [Sulfuritalea sp.]|nr:hypothetical protein [Sulfuritalea sp.]
MKTGRNALVAAVCALAGLVAAPARAADVPDDIEALLRAAAEDDARMAAAKAPPMKGAGGGLRGFAQLEAARTIDRPTHGSKMMGRIELENSGRLAPNLRWKLGARADYDAVFDVTDRYPGAVKRDQRFNLYLRENYLDIGAGDWEFRLGRQHVVWGEMVGLFFADVVSARDMREFILPEFNLLRIPQWAVRAEYFKGDFHGELLWIPFPTYDEIGKPGAEFFPVQPSLGHDVVYRDAHRPARKPANGNYGLRAGWLKNGWDISGFHYRSTDAAPTFYREVGPGVLIYQPRHDRISQFGGTLGKDLGLFVLKAEAVYTRGRGLTVLRLADADGLARQNTLDWALGMNFSSPTETRLNLQLFQSVITSQRDPDLIQDKVESGYSVLIHGKLAPRWEAEVLWVASLNRNDWMLRPKVHWGFEKNWRMVVGVDVFHGPALGYFGRYDSRDRVYTELRYSF